MPNATNFNSSIGYNDNKSLVGQPVPVSLNNQPIQTSTNSNS